jgi:hypothetical protein
MSKRFHLYVPGDYTFRGHYLPRIDQMGLDSFEASSRCYGIQRKDNNHLVVFLEQAALTEPSYFTSGKENDRFALKTPGEIELFEKTLGHHKEVSVFVLFYTARMTPMAWKVMAGIGDDPKVLVMDESRHFLPGPDCALELKALMV